MDKFFSQEYCDRCGSSLENGRIMSMFNRQCICMKCKDEERKNKNYKKACDADNEQIKKGNYNFGGIGLND